jgi:hypothetical protein
MLERKIMATDSEKTVSPRLSFGDNAKHRKSASADHKPDGKKAAKAKAAKAKAAKGQRPEVRFEPGRKA